MLHFNRGWLRRLRRERKMTLAEVGKAVNKNPATIFRAENPPSSGGAAVSVDTLLALLDFFGGDINDVIQEVDDDVDV